MAVSNEIIEQIKNSLDISEIIGDRVKLRRSSRGYEGLCPFHDERTPSFHVYSDTQSYYCFGCHEAGNIFTFVMKADGLSFPEAVKTLAARAGIDMPKYERKQGERSPYEILELAAKFYAENLGSGARGYLERRKLDEVDISRFSLGYAHNSWNLLVQYLRHKGVPDKQMLELGLALQGKQELYDKFRGRVIFPIGDIAGRVIAFGGRLLDGEGAKYINSSDNSIYHKRKNLYLLDKARDTIRKKKRSILVEGYMDAIRLHKCDFTEAVASLGTSLTSEQAETLSRFADRCYICYDSDKAGQTATIRGMYVLAENGLDVYVVTLPEGKDPDEFLSVNPPEKFEEAIQSSKPLVLKHMEILLPAIKDPATRKSATRDLFTSLSKLDIGEILQHKAQLSELTGVPPSKIENWLVSKNRPLLENAVAPVEVKGPEHPYEAALCSLLLRHAECRINIKPEEVEKFLRNSLARDTALAVFNESSENLMLVWAQIGETKILALVARGDEICARMVGLTLAEKWRNVCDALRKRNVVMRIDELTAKMRKSKATAEELLELSKLKSEIHR